MDGRRFDRLARAAGRAATRRGALRALVGAVLALGPLAAADPAAACLAEGRPCDHDRDACCSGACCQAANGRRFCVDVRTDRDHCGGCEGRRCRPDQVCRGGRCICPPDRQDICDDRCVDLSKDRNHCGQCGRGCGQCGRNCDIDLDVWEACCGGECVNVRTDRDNCGRCGRRCSPDRVCENASCVCPRGWERCRGVCIDLARDTDHCGGCDRRCRPGEVCFRGECFCQIDHIDCGEACIDPRFDDKNCGGCEIACGEGRECQDGWCVSKRT